MSDEVEVYRIVEDLDKPGFFHFSIISRQPRRSNPENDVSLRLYTIDTLRPDILLNDIIRELPGAKFYYKKDSLQFITPEKAVLLCL